MITSCPVISQSSGINITRIDFSDPQGGKGVADRLAATCEAHIRRYVNEGNDVTTADQMKEAINSYDGVQGVRVAAMESIDETLEMTQKIPGISKLNNFAFETKTCTSVRTCANLSLSRSQIKVYMIVQISIGKRTTIKVTVSINNDDKNVDNMTF